MSDALRVHAFRGVATFPLRVAIDSGRLRDRGVHAVLTFTGSSDELMAGLIDGAYDIVQAAPDNVIAWRDRTAAPIVAWYGGSSGPLSLILAPGVASVEALRGGPVAVDYPDTGWAPIMLRILADHGIQRDEIEQVAMGATPKVFAAVSAGRAPAGMVNEPWATRAVAAGCRIAADHRSVAPRLATSAGASMEAWLTANTPIATAVLGGIVAATTWILDPTNEELAVAALAEHLDSTPEEARAVYAGHVDPSRGWPPSAYLDPGGISALLGLRAAGQDDRPVDKQRYMTAAIYRALFDSPS